MQGHLQSSMDFQSQRGMFWRRVTVFTQESFPKAEQIPFKSRFATFKKMLKQYNASIICLQEIDQVQQFCDYLESIGYLTHFIAVQKKTSKGSTQGILFCVKMNEFQIAQYTHEYYEEKTHQYWMMELLHRSTKKQIITFGTHWQAKDKEDIRIKQANHIKSAIIDINLKNPDTPIIVMGDFNSEIDSQSINIISKMPLSKDQRFENVYPEGGWTKSKYGKTLETKSVDYIFYKGLTLVAYQSVPPIKQIPKTGLPDKYNPSDHIPLYSIFSFK